MHVCILGLNELAVNVGLKVHMHSILWDIHVHVHASLSLSLSLCLCLSVSFSHMHAYKYNAPFKFGLVSSFLFQYSVIVTH